MEPTHLNLQRIYQDLQKLVTAHRNALQNAISTGREFDRGYQAGMQAVIDRVQFAMEVPSHPRYLLSVTNDGFQVAHFYSDGSVERRKVNESRD